MKNQLFWLSLFMVAGLMQASYRPDPGELSRPCSRVGKDCGFFIGASYKPEHTVLALSSAVVLYEGFGYGLRWAIPDKTDPKKRDVEQQVMRKLSEVAAQAGATTMTLLAVARSVGIENGTGWVPLGCATLTTAGGMTGMYWTGRKV